MPDTPIDTNPPAACSLTPATFRDRRARIRQALSHRVGTVERTEGGFILRFERQPQLMAELAELVGLEAQCCSFLGLTLTVEPAGGSVSLQITGLEQLPEWITAPS